MGKKLLGTGRCLLTCTGVPELGEAGSASCELDSSAAPGKNHSCGCSREAGDLGAPPSSSLAASLYCPLVAEADTELTAEQKRHLYRAGVEGWFGLGDNHKCFGWLLGSFRQVAHHLNSS